MADNKKGRGFMIGFILIGIIGVVIGIMLAPKPGSETRRRLKDIKEGWRAMAEEMAATIEAQVVPTVEEAKGRLGPTIEGVRERTDPMIGTLRDQVTLGVEEASARVRRHSENGVKSTVEKPDADSGHREEV